MGLEQLEGAINEGLGMEPVTSADLEALYAEAEAEVDANQPDPQKVAALKLVQQDIELAEQYMESKRIPADINRVEDLYRAYVAPKNWPNSNQPRAHLGVPLILEAIESVISQVHMAFFSDRVPFNLEAKGTTSPAAARAMSKVLSWAMKMAGAKEEFRKTLKSTLEFPQGVIQWGWQTGTHSKKTYSKDSDTGKVVKHEELCDVTMPTLEYRELRNVFVDPSLRSHDIRKANWVIFQIFTNANALEEMRNDGYEIPDADELRTILADQRDEPATDSAKGTKFETYREYQAQDQDVAASADPLLQPLEILERWDNGQVITVLQRKLVIRVTDNEFGRIPANSCAFIDVLGSWYGFGIGKLLEGDQRFMAGVLNAWIDGLSLSLQPWFHRKKGVGQTSQNIGISPGKVVNDDGELTPGESKSNTQEALTAIEAAEARATRRVGANAGSEMPSQAMRTAEGVNAFSAGVQTRLQYFIDLWADLVYIPVLEAFLQLCKDRLQPEDINRILSEEDGKEYEETILDIYNGSYSIEVLSSTKLAAKRAMAQLLPMLLQLFQSEPVQEAMAAQQKKVDYVELVNQAMDLTGWPSQALVIDATPEDIQRYMQMQPGVMAAQAQGDVQKQKQQDALEQIEAKGTTQAGVHVVKHILDKSSEPEPAATAPLVGALTGQGQGSSPLALQPNVAPQQQAAASQIPPNSAAPPRPSE